MKNIILSAAVVSLMGCVTPNMNASHTDQMNKERETVKLLEVARLKAGVDMARAAQQTIELKDASGNVLATANLQGHYSMPERSVLPNRPTALEKVVDAQKAIAPAGLALVGTGLQNYASYRNANESIKSNERVRTLQIQSEERISTTLYALLAEGNTSEDEEAVISSEYPCPVRVDADAEYGGSGNATDGWGESALDGACVELEEVAEVAE